MAKVIVFGDIDSLTPLYVSVNGNKEIKITSGDATSIPVPAGEVSVFATTLSKFQRSTMSAKGAGALGAFADALTASTNDYIEGEVALDDDECLLIQVKQKGLKSQIFNKVVNEAEVSDYIVVQPVTAFAGQSEGTKSKWVALVLCMFFGMLGVHRFYEKKIFTGILCIVSFLAFFGSSFVGFGMDGGAMGIDAVMLIPAVLLFFFWPLDFFRILFRKK